MSQTTPTVHELTVLASEYILHGDKTKAWRKAFPKSKATPEAQYVEACRTFKSPKLNLRIEELKEISKKNSEEEFTMTISELKKVLATVIQKGVGQEDKEVDGTTIKGMPANLSSVVSAVKEFNLMDGNHAATKTDITIIEDTGEHEW